MATEIKHANIKTVKGLKRFLEGVPDSMRVTGVFNDDGVTASVWKADKDESGPRKFITFDTD